MQSRKASIAETITNLLVGIAYAAALNEVISWAYGFTLTPRQNGAMVFWFMVASMVRQYLIRRLFTNERLHQWLYWQYLCSFGGRSRGMYHFTKRQFYAKYGKDSPWQ